MTDYISREALGIGFCNPDIFEDKGYAKGWNAAIEIIKNAPAADVRENKRGKWIRIQDELCECSECARYWIPFGDSYDFHYCPNCGAKMEERI